MIGYLKGTLLFVEDDHIIIDTGGVGYQVFATLDAMNQGIPGDPIEVFIHTLVREGELSLFGFATRTERALFEMLIQVSGVGPKSALTIISQLGENGFVEALLTDNPLPFTRIKGIGKKTAERVLIDMSDRVRKLYSGTLPTARGAAPMRVSGSLLDVQEALLGLGFKRPEINAALQACKELADQPTEAILREALKRLRK